MGEVLTANTNTQPSVSPEQQGSQDGSLSYRERLRLGLGRIVERGMSMVELASGIALARDDLRLTRNAMRHLDEPFGGIIERQTSADRLSMDLESDIILDFRRDAQQAGYTDLDTMPAEMRATVADQSVATHADAMTAELTDLHPEWSDEEVRDAVATRLADISTLFSMSTEQRDAYVAAQLQYLELRDAIPEVQSTLSELRAERNERLSRIGGVALRGVVSFAGRVRDLPNALSARAMVAGMSLSERIHGMSAEKRRKTLWGTAAGVALAGLASYVAVRHGVGSGPSGNNYTLASSNTPLMPTHAGTVLPTHAGSMTPNHAGNFMLPNHAGTVAGPNHAGGAILPNHAGTPAAVPTPNHAGSLPNHVGSSMPNHAGSATPNHAGSAMPNHAGSNAPNHAGTTAPNHAGGNTLPVHAGTGGESLLGAKTSSEFFTGSGTVNQWPDTITVSPWNAHDLDGSLTGITRQMLIRSGVHNPTQTHIDTLVNTLRPQAQPNGFLLKGQTLDLRPATQALHGLLSK